MEVIYSQSLRLQAINVLLTIYIHQDYVVGSCFPSFGLLVDWSSCVIGVPF